MQHNDIGHGKAMPGKKGGSNTGSTANIGESLHIVQKNDGWDFNIKVLDFEKNHSAEVLLEKKQLPAVKIEITNNSDTDALVNAISFRLLDSSNNLLANTDLWAEASNEEVIKKEIKKGDTASGYKIFSDSLYTKDGELKEYDYNDISKLEILVPINIRKEGTKVKYRCMHIRYASLVINKISYNLSKEEKDINFSSYLNS